MLPVCLLLSLPLLLTGTDVQGEDGEAVNPGPQPWAYPTLLLKFVMVRITVHCTVP